MPAEAVRMEGIVKTFPGVVANAGIDFSLFFGEVHGLLGENGAGKTVLMSILYGLYQPDSGQIYVRETPVRIKSPAVAIRLGIGMVHQHFMLVPRLTVWENMAVGWEPRRGPFLDRQRMRLRVKELVEEYRLEIDPDAKVEELSVGEQQRVEILKALFRGAEILILDEPTAVLTEQEVENLFSTIRTLRDQGKAVVFITHKLHEAMAICDRVTVLRKGKRVGTLPISQATPEKLAEMMVGREVVFKVKPKPVPKEGKVLLSVENLTVHDERGLPAVHDASFELFDHEILGIAGVEGNGQKELVEALTGLRTPRSGKIFLLGKDVTGASARDLSQAGLIHIPEDRQATGLILSFSVAENLILGRQREDGFALGPFLQLRHRIYAYAQEAIRAFSIATPSPRVPVQNLSGGNQQRVILAREFGRNPKVVVAHQPTRGLDVAGMEFVWEKLLELRESGCGILLVSMDLDEILMLADRVAVMYRGEIVGIWPKEAANKRELGLAMLGGKVAAR